MKQNLGWAIFLLRVYQFVVAAVGAVLFFLLFYSKKDHIINLERMIDGVQLNLADLDFTKRTILIVLTLVLVVLLYLSAQKIVDVLGEFSKDRFFSQRVIDSFNRAGQLVLLIFLYYAVADSTRNFLIGGDSMSVKIKPEYLFLSLLLLILSQVFQRARILQEENKLTI